MHALLQNPKVCLFINACKMIEMSTAKRVNMKISYLPSDYLINALRNLEDIHRLESNFFLRAVRIKNNSSKKIQLNQYQFDIQKDSKTLKTIIYNEEMIKKKAKEVRICLISCHTQTYQSFS